MTAKLEISSKSRYRNTEVYAKGGTSFFGLWQKIHIPHNDFDEEITVESSHIGALDLLAHEVYGDSSLWFVIASYNNILDPFYGVSAGDTLRIPAKERVLKALRS